MTRPICIKHRQGIQGADQQGTPAKDDRRLRHSRSGWRLLDKRQHQRQSLWPSTGCRGPAESHEVSGFAARAHKVLSVWVTQTRPGAQPRQAA